jgi:succinate dehydrogenase / fumarate reductase cytochrome b subunit
VHVYCASRCGEAGRKARTVKYVVKKHTGAISRQPLMRWGGVTILLFIVWHLHQLHDRQGQPAGRRDRRPYNLLVDTFDTWWMTLIYLAAMAMLGACTCTTASGAPARRSASPATRAPARLRKRDLAFTLASSSPAASRWSPIFVLFGVIEK